MIEAQNFPAKNAQSKSGCPLRRPQDFRGFFPPGHDEADRPESRSPGRRGRPRKICESGDSRRAEGVRSRPGHLRRPDGRREEPERQFDGAALSHQRSQVSLRLLS